MCPSLPGNLLQVYEASYCDRGQQLAVSGAKPKARKIEVGAADSYINQGGSGCPDIRTDLLGGGAIGPAIRVRDMGPDAAYEESIGRIPPQGGPQDDGTAAVEGAGQSLVLPPCGGCNGGGGVAGFGDLRLPSPEQSSATYCNYNNYRPVSGIETEARGKGDNAVVGIGGFGIWRGCGQRPRRRSRRRGQRRGTGRRLRLTTS